MYLSSRFNREPVLETWSISLKGLCCCRSKRERLHCVEWVNHYSAWMVREGMPRVYLDKTDSRLYRRRSRLYSGRAARNQIFQLKPPDYLPGTKSKIYAASHWEDGDDEEYRQHLNHLLIFKTPHPSCFLLHFNNKKGEGLYTRPTMFLGDLG